MEALPAQSRLASSEGAVRPWATSHASRTVAVGACFSVSLSAADPAPTIHARLTSQVHRFLEETGWQLDQVDSFAGSIAYVRAPDSCG